MRTTLSLFLIAVGVGACMPPAYRGGRDVLLGLHREADFIAYCSLWPAHVASTASMPPRSGYVFKTKSTAYVGGEPYYTVNYLTGADKHHTPVRKIARVCHGTYVVHGPVGCHAGLRANHRGRSA